MSKPSPTVDQLLNEARGFLKRGNYNRAMTEAWEALEIAEKKVDATGILEQVKVIEEMRDMGVFWFGLTLVRAMAPLIRDRYPHFHKELMERVDTIQSTLVKDSPSLLISRVGYWKEDHLHTGSIGRLMFNFGREHLVQGNQDKALFWQEKGFELMKEDMEHVDECLMIEVSGQLAQLHTQSGNNESAIACLGLALELMDGEEGQQGLIAAWANESATPSETLYSNLYSCISDIAEAHAACGNYGDAIEICNYLLNRLENQDDAYQYRDMKTRFLIMMGDLYGKLGNYDESDSAIQRAVEKQNMNTFPELAWSLRCLAANLAAQKKYGEAEATYNRVLNLYKKTSGKDDYTTAEVLEELVNIYTETGNEEGLRITEARLEAIV